MHSSNLDEAFSGIEKKTKDVSKTLSETLDMDYDEVYKMVTKEQSIVKVKKGVSKDVADKIRKAELSGVEIAEDTPLGTCLVKVRLYLVVKKRKEKERQTN